MRKLFFFWFIALLMGFGLFGPATGRAEVNVSISVPLPGLVIPAPPGLIVVPGSPVYYSPEVDAGLFFYHGYWYRPYRGVWYIAGGYSGPWRAVGPRLVPRPLLDLPPGYRRMPPPRVRMPYPVVQRNWRTGENERRWDNERHGRHERYGWRDRGNDLRQPAPGRGYGRRGD